MKGYGPSDTPRSLDGEELISTSDICALFPSVTKARLLQVMAANNVPMDRHIKGKHGQAMWPRSRTIATLAVWELGRA